MPRKIHYCVNHPDIAAEDKCHVCEKHVCFNCQRQAFGHTFCSGACYASFLGKEAGRALYQLFRWLLAIPLLPFRAKPNDARRVLFQLLLTAGLVASLIMIWRLTEKIEHLETAAVPSTVEVDTTFEASIARKVPEEAGMVHSGTIDIRGEAAPNRIVSVTIDGEIYQAILPKKGAFVFKDVPLHYGDNRVEVRAISHEGRVAVLQSMRLHYSNPSVRYLSRDFRRGNRSEPLVALTFDGGAENNIADEILDFLKAHNIKSTFFLTGNFIRTYPKTVKRIVREGHEVGNHTWSHPHLTSFADNRKHETLETITEDKLKHELERTASLFKVVAGQEMAPLWRAPYGEYNKEILLWAARAGYRHVGWTVGRGWEETMDTLDWVADKESKAYHTAEEIVAKVLNYGNGKKNGAAGSIVLMHLGSNRNDDFPHQKLPEIIEGLEGKGYRLVPVSAMMAKGDD